MTEILPSRGGVRAAIRGRPGPRRLSSCPAVSAETDRAGRWSVMPFMGAACPSASAPADHAGAPPLQRRRRYLPTGQLGPSIHAHPPGHEIAPPWSARPCLGEDILVPDLAGWRRERMPVFPDAPYATLAPDWVCEVLSPSTRKLDLHGKRAAYGREQVGHLWLIDPADRTLEAFELRKGEWVLIATAQDDAPVRIRPFDAVTFSLGDLWPPKVAPAE